jgi:hypothetical protein
MNEMGRAVGRGTEPSDIGYEEPTEGAELKIFLTPHHSGKRGWITALGRWASMVRRPVQTSASNDMPSRAAYLTVALRRSDTILTAFYLEAEQARLPHEPPYDVDRGLRRFNAWLDGPIEPSAEAEGSFFVQSASEELPTAAAELIIELLSA